MKTWKVEFKVAACSESYAGKRLWSPIMMTISIEAKTRMNAVALATQAITEEIIQTIHYRIGTVISCMPVAEGSDENDEEGGESA